MRVTKRLMAALLACLMLLSLLPVPAYAADDGRIALLAVTQDGYVIEPEYIGYRSGDTVKDVLKNSGHTFSGIDSGFITAVDGRTDNYSLHYDGDGYALDASAKGLTAIWFTTNANQSYGDDLLHLAERMAAYNTSTNGLKDYAAAKEAYDAAHSGFYAAANAAAGPPAHRPGKRHRKVRDLPGGRPGDRDHRRHPGRQCRDPGAGHLHQRVRHRDHREERRFRAAGARHLSV